MKRIFALLMVAASSCLAASPNPSIFSNTTAIAITDSVSPPTAATPYPSTINVTGLSGAISKVSIQLNNLSHDLPDDIDMLLVSPTGQKAVIFADAGGNTPVTNITVTLDDAAPSALPDAGPLVSGIFQPANYAPIDTFPSPAPTPGALVALSTFKGINPNGTWSLYVVDDQTGNTGSIAGGWSIIVNTVTSVTNSALITINDSGSPPTPATSYPSTISVSNVVGNISKLTVQLFGISHGFPNDIDMLLVSPSGQSVIIWGEAGGPAFINNVTVTLDDAATQAVPSNSSVTSGTYQPSNYGSDLSWPSLPTNVVVTQTFTPLLSTFNGSNPNGDWSLYIVDDSSGDSGSIVNGWALNITAAPSPTPSLQLSGSNVVLSWPATALGFTLQSSASLVDSNSWTTVTPAPTYVSGQNFVTNAINSSNLFYRLK